MANLSCAATFRDKSKPPSAASPSRRCDPAGKWTQRLMTKFVLCRHRSRLLQRNAVKRFITHDGNFAMHEPEVGDQFCRRLAGYCRCSQ
jgi:hypothetical protein